MTDTRPFCRVVVAPAVRWQGVIYVGVRHYDDIMQGQMTAAGIKESDITEPMEEGFVDNYRQWMDRHEALAVARASGQIGLFRDVRISDFGLQSENLF